MDRKAAPATSVLFRIIAPHNFYFRPYSHVKSKNARAWALPEKRTNAWNTVEERRFSTALAPRNDRGLQPLWSLRALIPLDNLNQTKLKVIARNSRPIRPIPAYPNHDPPPSSSSNHPGPADPALRPESRTNNQSPAAPSRGRFLRQAANRKQTPPHRIRPQPPHPSSPTLRRRKTVNPVLRLRNSGRRNPHLHRLRPDLRPNRADLRRLRPRPAPDRNRQQRHSTQEGRSNHLQRFPLHRSLRSRIHEPRRDTANHPRMVEQSLPPPRRPQTAPAFWSYQSGSYEKRPNWIVPLHAGFHQQNYSRHERQRLRRRHSHHRRLAQRRRPRSRPHRASPAPDRTASHHARRNSRHGSREYEARANARSRRELPHPPHLRLSSSRRLFPHPNRIPPPDDSPGISNGHRARQRFRPHLVRLGIRSKRPAKAGLRHAPHRKEARLLLGNARRRLAK